MAIERYKAIINRMAQKIKSDANTDHYNPEELLGEIAIDLKMPCEQKPHPKMKEECKRRKHKHKRSIAFKICNCQNYFPT